MIRTRSINTRLHLGATAIQLALAAALITPQVQAQQAAQTYDVPPGQLSEALSRFAQQGNVSLAIPSDKLQGLRTDGLHGIYSVEEGFAVLLRGTGYAIGKTGSGYVLVPATAETTEAAPAQGKLPAINVTAAAETSETVRGFVALGSRAGSKSDTTLLETPQTVSVVTRDQLDAQQATNLTQAARYIPGIYFGDNTDTRNEYLKARGFTLDQYQDGLKLLTQGAWIENKVDPFFLERIEVLEGPSSGLYGQSSPGGLVNLVSKRPTADAFGQVQLQTGSYGRAQAAVDVGGPVNGDGTVLYRFTALARDTGTQVKDMKEQRIAIAPAITWAPDSNTSFTLLMSYLNDPEGGFWSSLPYLGTLLNNPALPGGKLSRDLNTGQPNYEEFKRERISLGYEFMHRFDQHVTFRQNFRFAHVESTYNALQAYIFNTGTASLQRDNYRYQGNADSYALDNQLQITGNTGPLQHKALAGVDYQTISRHDFSRYGAGPNLNVLSPVYNFTIALPNVNLNRDQTMEQFGLYLQDQISWGQTILTLTGRQDHATSKSTNNLNRVVTRSTDDAFTGRAGLSYQFTNGIAPYLSYSTSFNPSSGSSFGGESFKPTTGQQKEVGIKYKPAGHDAIYTLSAFDLTQQNVLTTDPLHTGFQVQTGEINVRGVEASATANIGESLKMMASVTHINPVVTQDNSGLRGKDPSNVPRNAAKLWLDYSLHSGPLAGLSMGGGARYIGKSYADTKNVYTIPGYVLFDAALRYDLFHMNPKLKGWQASVNASNLADKIYVSDCSDISCRWGQGRTVYATVDYRW